MPNLHVCEPSSCSNAFFTTAEQQNEEGVKSRRRGDRIARVFAATRNVRFWHKADITAVLIRVRFWG